MSTDSSVPLSIGEVAQRIHLVRGQRVVLDADLVAFYGETTKRFNQQVRRNLARFPADFMFPAGRGGVRGFKVAIRNLKKRPGPAPQVPAAGVHRTRRSWRQPS